MGQLDLVYEKIIRNAHNCKQGAKNGAEANLHAGLVGSHTNYLEAISERQADGDTHSKEQTKILNNYTKQCEIIADYLIKAIQKILSTKEKKHHVDCKLLKEIEIELQNMPEFETIEKCIVKIIEIMKKMGYKNWVGVPEFQNQDGKINY